MFYFEGSDNAIHEVHAQFWLHLPKESCQGQGCLGLSQREEEEGEELTSKKNISSTEAAFLSPYPRLVFTKNS